jgi:hypothetical protein
MSQPNKIHELMGNSVALEILKQLAPETKETFRIKRYLPVPGYLSPNVVTTNLLTNTLISLSQGPENMDGSAAALAAMTCWQTAHFWPMYAVTQELTEAMLQTEPPDDVVWKDLSWPIPAATFLLPDTKEVREHFLTSAPLSISAGRVSTAPVNLTKDARHLLDLIRMPQNETERDMIVLTYFDDKVGVPCCHDLTVKPTWTLAESTRLAHDRKTTQHPYQYPVEPIDLQRMRRCAQMLINLLSFCSSDYMPKVEEHGPIILRREKVKHGKVKQDGLAGVRWLGVGYVRKRVALGGKHASPEDPFWRKGHHRWQPYGPGRTLKRLIWIEPVLCCV